MPAPRLLTIITALILLQGQMARAEYSLEQLQEIERYVMSKNSAALESLLRSNPELMAGNDPLAKELRSFMENNLRYFEVVWAALRSGLYLTTVNRYLTDEEAGYIVDNCESRVTVASKYLADVAKELPRFAPNCEAWLMTDGVEDGYLSYEDAIAEYRKTHS